MGKISEVIRVYRETESIKATASALNICTGKVKKILYSQGILENSRSKKILEYHRKGFAPKAIADLMNISEKTVNLYLPYTRGLYSENQTENAKRIREWRESKKKGIE
ncbi:helix-turn-helix transcriptional regulator [Eubacterium sp.]|uniref:helix-turn-helix transcriptional regulator n=1 Tax=Eubacterium sp. TaxID=142586 RepID=UPI002FC9D1D0